MNKYKMLSVTIFVALAQNAFASIDSSETIANPSVEILSAPQSAQTTPLMRDGIFKAVGEQTDADGSKFLDFTPEYISQNGKIYQNFDAVTLSDQEAVAVRFRDDGLVEMTMQLDDAEEGQEPDKAILTQEQFAQMKLSFDKEGDVAVLERDYSKYDLETYARHGRGGHARHRSHGRHRGYGRMHYRAENGHAYVGCVAYVASRIGFSGRAGNGVGMASALARTGNWHFTSSPSAGDVCSYSGGPRGAGDVCIYEGGDCCRYDLGCHSMRMSGYHLRGWVTRGGFGGWGSADASGGHHRHRRHR